VERVAVGLGEDGDGLDAERQAQMIRRAISPRLATRIDWNMVQDS